MSRARVCHCAVVRNALGKGSDLPHYLQLGCSHENAARCASADLLTDTSIKKVYIFYILYRTFKKLFKMFICNRYDNNNKKAFSQRHLLTHTVLRFHGNKFPE